MKFKVCYKKLKFYNSISEMWVVVDHDRKDLSESVKKDLEKLSDEYIEVLNNML